MLCFFCLCALLGCTGGKREISQHVTIAADPAEETSCIPWCLGLKCLNQLQRIVLSKNSDVARMAQEMGWKGPIEQAGAKAMGMLSEYDLKYLQSKDMYSSAHLWELGMRRDLGIQGVGLAQTPPEVMECAISSCQCGKNVSKYLNVESSFYHCSLCWAWNILFKKQNNPSNADLQHYPIACINIGLCPEEVLRSTTKDEWPGLGLQAPWAPWKRTADHDVTPIHEMEAQHRNWVKQLQDAHRGKSRGTSIHTNFVAGALLAGLAMI